MNTKLLVIYLFILIFLFENMLLGINSKVIGHGEISFTYIVKNFSFCSQIFFNPLPNKEPLSILRVVIYLFVLVLNASITLTSFINS